MWKLFVWCSPSVQETPTYGLHRLYMRPPNKQLTHVIIIRFCRLYVIIQHRSREHFNLLILLSCNFNNLNNFVTLSSTSLRLPEDDADSSKHVAVLMVFTVLLIYTYML